MAIRYDMDTSLKVIVDSFYLNGDNEKIDDVYFHLLDNNGERTPDSEHTLDNQVNTYFIIHGFTAGVGDKWLNGVDDFDNTSDWKVEPDDYKQWEKLDSTQHSIGLSIKSYDPKANIVIVDWGNFSSGLTYDISLDALWQGDFHLSPLYFDEANQGTDKVARAINDYINQKSISPDKITLVGHSLGGQTAGKAGKLSDGKISKIIAMDPAGPGFESYDRDSRLSFDDAKDVYALHTSESFGYDGPLATYDLYINGSVEKSLSGGLDNDYSQPDTGSFIRPISEEIRKHSAANHFTALMFAESASSQDKMSESFFASHLYNSQISDRFYGGVLTDWFKALDITRQSTDPFTGLKLNIDNLFSKAYFSDEYFKWDFETSAPFTDYAGFWYDNDYLNRWWTGYQEDAVYLTSSPDTSATTSTTPSWLAWWGPIDGGTAWFDQRNKKGELNFKVDSNEIQTKPSNGVFTLDFDENERNNFTDITYPIFQGLDNEFNEVRVTDPRQIIDFRDGLIIAEGNVNNPMIDTITGLDYGIPLVGLPGSQLNIISTFKHAPVARWRDDTKFPSTENSYRFTPDFIDASTASLFRGIDDKFFDDDFNVYSLYSDNDHQDIDFQLDALAYEYAFISLVKTTNELLNYLGVDKSGWSDYIVSTNTPDSILTIYSMASALSYIYSGIPDSVEDFNFDFDFKNKKGFSPFSKRDVIGLWDTILRTSPTHLGTDEESLFKNNIPLDITYVDNLIDEIPLEKIASSYVKRTKKLKNIINTAFDVGGKDLIVPALSGLKRLVLENGEDSLIQTSITESFEIDSIDKYKKDQKQLLKTSVYPGNYSYPIESGPNKDLYLHIGKKALKNATKDLNSGNEVVLDLKVKLSSPAPLFGLSVNYLLGGGSQYKKDYELVSSEVATLNFEPGSDEATIKFKLYPTFLDDTEKFQIKLLSTIAGYSINEDKGGMQIKVSSDKKLVSKYFSKEVQRDKEAVIIGTDDNDFLAMPTGNSMQHIQISGGDGEDIFSLSTNTIGVPYLNDFNPYEGDKIVLNSDEFDEPTDVLKDNIHFLAGKLIYKASDSLSSKIIALFGDGINDTDQFLSSYGINEEKYIEFT